MEKKLKRKKPKFLRQDSHKMMKLGKGIKKKQKWRAAKGRQSKIRLHRKGHAQRPRIGWGSAQEVRNLVSGVGIVRIENIKSLESVKKGEGIIIASIGKKKRDEIIKKANEMKIKILNKYRENKDATK
jgi:large subunit ribosomal protein L32e